MDAITRLKISIGDLVIANAELSAVVEDMKAAAEKQAAFDAAVDRRDMPSGAPAPESN
tara:strand:+ start:1311 stop:1484 length:174 start_codon:yes stop_codon:yes gene_type:complete